jgi:hypothetical protein
MKRFSAVNGRRNSEFEFAAESAIPGDMCVCTGRIFNPGIWIGDRGGPKSKINPGIQNKRHVQIHIHKFPRKKTYGICFGLTKIANKPSFLKTTLKSTNTSSISHLTDTSSHTSHRESTIIIIGPERNHITSKIQYNI